MASLIERWVLAWCSSWASPQLIVTELDLSNGFMLFDEIKMACCSINFTNNPSERSDPALVSEILKFY